MGKDIRLKGPVVECVPNFSEGREPHIIRTIQNEISSVPGVKVLDTHSDVDHNRSVITFIGGPDAVVDAALAAVRSASKLIDLNRHEGAHPRLGAADVVPLIPVREMDMEGCIGLARDLARRIWNEIQVPTYLYGYAALKENRRRLEKVRLKGFEQMRELLKEDDDRRPDFGDDELHPTAGATIVGARDYLVALNVDLKSDDLQTAKVIASAIREKNGGLPGLKAMGIRLESKSCVQVSMNITRSDLVSPFQVLERVRKEASIHGIEVLGGELVGLMPMQSALSSLKEAVMLEDLEPRRIIEFNL